MLYQMVCTKPDGSEDKGRLVSLCEAVKAFAIAAIVPTDIQKGILSELRDEEGNTVFTFTGLPREAKLYMRMRSNVSPPANKITVISGFIKAVEMFSLLEAIEPSLLNSTPLELLDHNKNVICTYPLHQGPPKGASVN